MANSEEEFFEDLAKGKSPIHHYKVEGAGDEDEKAIDKKPIDSGLEAEGKLTIDVYQTPAEIIIESAIAGVNPDDLDINVSRDSITIKGERHRDEEINDKDYFYRECYWGRFSRSVILPEEVDPDNATVNFKNGILTVKLPKLSKQKAKKLKVKTE